MAKNKYMYVINDSNSAVTLIINHNHCFNGTIPDPVNIKPHHKQTIIIKVAEDFACLFESTFVYFSIKMHDYKGLYDFPRFEYYKGAGKDPHLSIARDPFKNIEVVNSTTLRITND